MLRDQIATSVIESAVNSATQPAASAPVVPPALVGVYGVDEAQLRGLIDSGFVHLSSKQRDEVYASLTRMLADPKNALARPLIIEQLAQRASAVRSAHEQLALLSNAQKRAIVADARAEYERLQPEERDQLLQLLRSGVAPIPRDLNDQMLAAFMAPELPQGR
jgi:PHD/YefM family antitoxin component YafN of YafNO toxin-antitoxin module